MQTDALGKTQDVLCLFCSFLFFFTTHSNRRFSAKFGQKCVLQLLKAQSFSKRSTYRTRSRDNSPVTSSRYRSGTSQHTRSDRHRHTSPHRESSYDSSYRRQRRDKFDNPRSVSRRDDSRHSSPRRENDSPRRSSSINRRVKVQHRIVDDDNKTPQYKEVFLLLSSGMIILSNINLR